MLPSTGYFKGINCPFYDNGYCERPYCHFRHARRDVSTTGPSTSDSTQTVAQPQSTSSSTVITADKDVIEKLVSEAVKKVLADPNKSLLVTDTNQIVDKVVEGLINPQHAPAGSSTSNKEISSSQSSKCVYNPTPIAELKRRHISIASYEPTRESKAVRRKSPDVEKPWMEIIRNISTDTESKPKKMKYTPTAISQIEADKNSSHTYIPTAKTDSSLSLYSTADEEYIPERRKKTKKHREEYVPRKPKISLKDEQRLEDDSFDVLHDLLGESNLDPIILDNEESKDFSNINTYNNIDNDIDIMNIDLTKEIELKDVYKISKDENELKKLDLNNENKFESSKVLNKQPVENETNIKGKFQKDVTTEGDSKQIKDDSKSLKSKDEDLKGCKSREDSQHSKSIDDHKHNKSKDKVREDKKDKSHSKEKDKYKHSSKSTIKGHSSSSSKDNKSKEREKSRSKSSSSHKSKSKDSKSDKEKSSSSSKDSKDKSRHKNYKKEKRRSRSTSSERKKTSKSSHKHHNSHSSHKSIKPIQKPAESENNLSKYNQDNLEREDIISKSSPEYEEFSPMYDEQLLEASDSEHDVEEECLKIFHEYQGPDHSKEIKKKETRKSTETEETEEVIKKRVAHPGAESSIKKPVGPSQPVKRLPTPSERMHERWKLTRQLGGSKVPLKDPPHNGNGRIRIAQVPYAKSLAQEKEKLMKQAAKLAVPKTVAQTSKTGARVAHVPQVVPDLVRPTPLGLGGTQKFPLSSRQFYVNAMQDICNEIYTNSEDAAQRAVKEEHMCYEKCMSLNVYKNSCMLTIHKLRKEKAQKEDQPTTSYGSISHAAVLTGKVKGTWSVIKPKRVETNIKGEFLYNMLSKWIMTEQELRDNGFPRAHPDGTKGRAILYSFNKRGQSTISKVPNERYCCRCHKPYMVDDDGFAVQNKNCIYHWGRKNSFRGKSEYYCCKQDGTSEGCCDAPNHVWDAVDAENLKGYVSTFDKEDATHSVFSLDCEMCYTTQGLELTRVTVINEDCKVVYETLVKPTHPIVDYNTRFSGIIEEDMKNVTTTLLDVQATFLSMFSSKTILIGHSLESDFKALKLLHDTVVDTSVMFPHKSGSPKKRALKTLCSEYLKKIIQNEVSGHDSKEDAISCMELVLWKVKEDAKLL